MGRPDERRFARLPVEFKVLRRSTDQVHVEPGVDISLGGIGLLSREFLYPGSEWSLVLTTPDGELEVPVRACVRHVRTAAREPPFRVGLQLIPPEAALVAKYETLIDRLFRMPEGRRAHRRILVNSQAIWMAEGGAPVQIRLINLSSSGALIVASEGPPKGTRGKLSVVSVKDGTLHEIPCVSQWNRRTLSEDFCGLHFDEDPECRGRVLKLLQEHLFSISARRDLHFERDLGKVKLGDFVIEEPIGRGEHSELYRARGVKGPLQWATVALKRLQPALARRPERVEQFAREADLGALIQHAACVRVHGMLSLGDEHWMVMEHLEGEALSTLLGNMGRRSARPPLFAATGIALELLSLLEECHGLRAPSGRPLEVVHGHIRPSTVFVLKKGGVKLLDFGGASLKGFDGAATARAGIELGCMPPEWCGGEHTPSPQVDVYQLGVLLYEVLTGAQPFQASDPKTLGELIRRGPVPPSQLRGDIPPELNELILSALHFDRSRRFGTAAQMRSALVESGACPDPEQIPRLCATLYERGA